MDVIGSVMGPAVTLINASEEAAWDLKRALRDGDLLSSGPGGEATLYASDQPSDFRTVAQQFLQEELQKPVLPVDIDRY